MAYFNKNGPTRAIYFTRHFLYMQVLKKALLIILDGFGIRDNPDYNAISQANMPNWKYFTSNYAFGALDASSEYVGLPPGQFGNSEVGHLIIIIVARFFIFLCLMPQASA